MVYFQKLFVQSTNGSKPALGISANRVKHFIVIWRVVRFILPLLPYEDEGEQDDVHSKGNGPRDLQTHVASFLEQITSSLAVRFSNCRVILCSELIRATSKLSSLSTSRDVVG